jgi:formate dehydrogenase assembly factor FdhD
MDNRSSNRSHTGCIQTRQLTAEILEAAIEGFEAQKRRIDEQIAQVRQLLKGVQPIAATTSGTHAATSAK